MSATVNCANFSPKKETWNSISIFFIFCLADNHAAAIKPSLTPLAPAPMLLSSKKSVEESRVSGTSNNKQPVDIFVKDAQTRLLTQKNANYVDTGLGDPIRDSFGKIKQTNVDSRRIGNTT